MFVSKPDKTTNSSPGILPDLDIIHRKPPLLIVFKPAGMRTRGKFPITLEWAVSEHEGTTYSCLSPLDTSCAGLCVLIEQDISQQLQHKEKKVPTTILHSMTALVYGNVPATWMPGRDVKISFQSKWKKKRKQSDKEKLAPVSPESVQLSLVEKSDMLTTICIKTKNPSAASICQFLRLEGHGVVGDIYCRQEYLKLKRSIRNRIKDKLCIGCYEIEVDGLIVKKDIPDKLLASFWQTHCSNGTKYRE